MQSVTKYIGLDVSKESIAVAIADAGREEPRFYGMITNSEKTLLSCLSKLGGEGIHLEVCYEAGPTGYAIFRWLQKKGISCSVIAPSLIPRKPGDRVKTDRKDALRLAPKGKKWTKKYLNWLNTLTFANGNHQIVFQEYLRAMQEEEMRLKRLEEQIVREAKEGPRAALIQALQVLKGVALLTAVTLVAEIGTFLRFPKASNFMGYTGLVPSEYSTGQTTRKGKTTKAGNKHVRRIVVESAWSYRHRPAVKGELLKRQENQPADIQQIAWHCQHRLHSKYLKMVRSRGMHKNKAITAVARELSAFIWEIACVVERREPSKA